jgi:hypothetical protein
MMKLEVHRQSECIVLGFAWNWGLAAIELGLVWWAIVIYYDR